MKKYINTVIVPYDLYNIDYKKFEDILQSKNNIYLHFNKADFKLGKQEKIILSILEKILVRGSKTILSSYEEGKILKYIFNDENIFKKTKSIDNNVIKSLELLNFIYKIEISIINGLLKGSIDIKGVNNIIVDIKNNNLSEDEKEFCINIINQNLPVFFNNISILYGYDVFLDDLQIKLYHQSGGNGKAHISDNNKDSLLYIEYNKTPIINENGFDEESIHEFINQEKNLDKNIMEFFLDYLFRKKHFREGQYESISNLFKGNDTLVLLPTGGGKSLIFQFYSLLSPGTTLVVCPLISLIDDQVNNLYNVGINNVNGIISDTKTKNEILEELEKTKPYLIYVSPEKIQTLEFQNFIKEYVKNQYINLLAIDETHCVSEWGHDFRSSYLNIGKNLKEITQNSNFKQPLLALTGTASNAVLKDIQRELQLKDFNNIITPKTFNREELNFKIFNCKTSEKEKTLEYIINEYIPEFFNENKETFYQIKGEKTNGGVIFCPHSRGNHGVEHISNIVNEKTIVKNSQFYGAKNQTDKEKLGVNREFKNNTFSLLVTTKGFGMGIDKPNIRFTVHYGIPNSIESFYQEVGRAGRDGNKALNILIVSSDDDNRTEDIFNLNNTIVDLYKIFEKSSYTSDDIIKGLYFHLSNFIGVNEERTIIKRLLTEYNTIKIENENIIKYNNQQEKVIIEKGFQRLIILGIIDKYYINYSKSEIIFKFAKFSKESVISQYYYYVSNYNKSKIEIEKEKIALVVRNSTNELQIVFGIINLLIDFIYKTIENYKRNAIKEVFNLSKEDDSSIIKKKIIKYLEGSKNIFYEKLIKESPILFNGLKDIILGVETEDYVFGGIISKKEAENIHFLNKNYLDHFPDNPQLLLLDLFTETIILNNIDPLLVSKKIDNIINISVNKYLLDKNIITSIILFIFFELRKIDEIKYIDIINNFLYSKDINFIKQFVIYNKYSDIDVNTIYIKNMLILLNEIQ